jgi:hypothetical protein
MKKNVAIICLLASSYSYSQSIQLFYNERYVPNEDTLTIVVPNNSSSDHYLDMVNVSSNDMDLVVVRKRIFMLSGAENTFCFPSCFSPEFDGPTSSFPFPAGDTLSEFETTYNPKGQKGISIVKYTFYDNINPTDATSVIFKFDSETVGIVDNITEATSLKIFPNPTAGQLIIDNGQLTIKNVEIFDVVGKKQESRISDIGKLEIVLDISHLTNGIYFLKVDNKTFKIIKN